MALEGGEGSASCPGHSLARERPSTHCTGGWVGPRAGLDRCGKSRPLRGFVLETIQPLASRYTDWATRPTLFGVNIVYCSDSCDCFASKVLLLLLLIVLGHFLTTSVKPTSIICWIQSGSGFMLQQILSIQWMWNVTQYTVALGGWMVHGVAQLNVQIQCAVWCILQHVLFCNSVFIVYYSVGYSKTLQFVLCTSYYEWWSNEGLYNG